MGRFSVRLACPCAVVQDEVPFVEACEELPELSSVSVTSNLDLKIQKAHHGQGGGSTVHDCEKWRKSFVVKILTSKPLALKILQTIFAKG